jgi:hypothetical protein
LSLLKDALVYGGDFLWVKILNDCKIGLKRTTGGILSVKESEVRKQFVTNIHHRQHGLIA